MPYEIVKDKVISNAVRVEFIDHENEGIAEITIFLEPRAWMRAHQYAEWMNRYSNRAERL